MKRTRSTHESHGSYGQRLKSKTFHLLGLILVLALLLSSADATSTSNTPNARSHTARRRVIPDSFRVAPEVQASYLADIATLKLEISGYGANFTEARIATIARRDWIEAVLAQAADSASRPIESNSGPEQQTSMGDPDGQDSTKSIYTISERGEIYARSTGFGCGGYDEGAGFFDDIDGCETPLGAANKASSAQTNLEIDFDVGTSGERAGARALTAFVAAVHNATDVSGPRLTWKFSAARQRVVNQELRRAALDEIQLLVADFEDLFAAEGLRIAGIENWDEQRRGTPDWKGETYGWDAVRDFTGIARNGTIEEGKFEPREMSMWLVVGCRLIAETMVYAA